MTDFVPTPSEIAGKVVIVTGAASGIGREIAELFHARGAKVIAEDINPKVNALERPDWCLLWRISPSMARLKKQLRWTFNTSASWTC